jgi:mRNA interferase HigB
MVIISKAILRDFSEQCPEAHTALYKWYEETKAANWKDYAEIKKTFNSVDAVGNDRYVFNIKGNHYRLIAMIIFKIRTVFILFIGTHNQYDKLKAAEVTFKI